MGNDMVFPNNLPKEVLKCQFFFSGGLIQFGINLQELVGTNLRTEERIKCKLVHVQINLLYK